MMAEANFKEYFANMDDETLLKLTGFGAVLSKLGSAADKEWQSRFGVCMDKAGRAANDRRPNAIADPVIDIQVPNVLEIMVRPDGGANNKARGHGYANDVGMTDKSAMCNIPPTLIIELFLEKIVKMLDGRLAQSILNDVEAALNTGLTENEDGSFVFDKKAVEEAHPITNAVEVAEWTHQLKRAGKPRKQSGASHVSMEIVPIPTDPNPANEEVATVENPIPDTPTPAHSGSDPEGDTGTNFIDTWGA